MARRSPKLKESEYGGRDTRDTKGIQTFPHTPTPEEKLRVIYDTDESDPESVPTVDGVTPMEL